MPETGDISAQLTAEIIISFIGKTANLVDAGIIDLIARCFQRRGSKISGNGAMVSLTTGLGDNLHHATGRAAILRLKATCFDLYFFDKGKVDAAAYREILPGKDTQAAECSVRYVNAVSHIEVLQSGAAGDGWIRLTGATAICYARRNIKQTGNVTLRWNFRVKSVTKI